MTSSAVQPQQLKSIPLAVIRRQARPSELSRLVPEYCGLIWNEVRAQQAKAGRNVAIYWNSEIRLEVGVELLGPFIRQGEVVLSATPAGAVASATHFGPYSRPRRGARRSPPVVQGQQPHSRRPQLGDLSSLQPEWNTNPSQIRTDVYYQLAH